VRNDPRAALSCGAGPAGGVCGPLTPCPASLVQSEVREFPTGLLVQQDRNKVAAGAEPVAGRVSGRRRLRFFL